MINFAVMKSSLSHILESIKEANELLEQGAIDDAVMLSGEALAKAYENWSANLNYQQPTTNEINIMAIAASCHCGALAAMGNFQDAYATSIGAILQISIDNNSSNNIDHSLLSIYTTALFSWINILSSPSSQTADFDKEHVETITRYIASMLYHYYVKVGKNAPNSPYLEDAYGALNHIRQFSDIETPLITVLNKQISPDKPHVLIGDLVGRSIALSLLAD